LEGLLRDVVWPGVCSGDADFVGFVDTLQILRSEELWSREEDDDLPVKYDAIPRAIITN
jgi:hypothetical protein